MGWIGISEVIVGALAVLGFSLGLLFARERRVRRRFRVLADIATVSDAGGSLEETFDAICGILVPELADFCMIDVFDEDRVPRRAALRVAPGAARKSSEAWQNVCPRFLSRCWKATIATR